MVGPEHPRADTAGQPHQNRVSLLLKGAVLLPAHASLSPLPAHSHRIRRVSDVLVPSAAAPPQDIQIPASRPSLIQGSHSFHWLCLSPLGCLHSGSASLHQLLFRTASHRRHPLPRLPYQPLGHQHPRQHQYVPLQGHFIRWLALYPSLPLGRELQLRQVHLHLRSALRHLLRPLKHHWLRLRAQQHHHNPNKKTERSLPEPDPRQRREASVQDPFSLRKEAKLMIFPSTYNIHTTLHPP